MSAVHFSRTEPLLQWRNDFIFQTTRSTDSNEDGDFVDHWSLPFVTFQKCFHLHNFGIFFLIVNVTQPDGPDGIRNIKAWVQCAYPNRIARNFRFSLELLMGNKVATFTDYVVGAQSDSGYIQSNNNCLNIDTAEHYDKVTIEMKISRTLGSQNLPRNDRTDCRTLLVSSFWLFILCSTESRIQSSSRGTSIPLYQRTMQFIYWCHFYRSTLCRRPNKLKHQIHHRKMALAYDISITTITVRKPN